MMGVEGFCRADVQRSLHFIYIGWIRLWFIVLDAIPLFCFAIQHHIDALLNIIAAECHTEKKPQRGDTDYSEGA